MRNELLPKNASKVVRRLLYLNTFRRYHELKPSIFLPAAISGSFLLMAASVAPLLIPPNNPSSLLARMANSKASSLLTAVITPSKFSYPG